MKKLFQGRLILASQSPRRAHLLSLIGLEFEVRPAHIDESAIAENDPGEHVKKLALAKAEAVARQIDDGLVVGADTIVVLDGEILGKPSTPEEATGMLKRLSGRVHKVYTGFSLIEMPGGRRVADFEVTSVHFRRLMDWEIENYVSTQNPMDKAGAYGIQDQSAVFADRIEGCFYNVVGFPLTKFYLALMDFVKKDAK